MRIALRLSGLVVATVLAGSQVVSAAAGSPQQEIPAPNMFNPCNGEVVLTTGTVHVSFVSNGRHLHMRSNFQDVKGVGAATGFDYVVTGSTQFHGNFNLLKGQAEFTTLTIVHVIAPGTGQHFINTFLFHEAGTPSGHVSLTTHSDTRCLSMSAAGHLVLGERATSTASVAQGDSAPAASAASTATDSTTAHGSKAESRESSSASAGHGQARGLSHRFGLRAR